MEDLVAQPRFTWTLATPETNLSIYMRLILSIENLIYNADLSVYWFTKDAITKYHNYVD